MSPIRNSGRTRWRDKRSQLPNATLPINRSTVPTNFANQPVQLLVSQLPNATLPINQSGGTVSTNAANQPAQQPILLDLSELSQPPPQSNNIGYNHLRPTANSNDAWHAETAILRAERRKLLEGRLITLRSSLKQASEIMASFVDPPVKREFVIQTEELISAVEKEIRNLGFLPLNTRLMDLTIVTSSLQEATDTRSTVPIMSDVF
ncbi:hypothetical protein K435DRAFT_845115 [Dendrothele bispora CBS 962.96]|uniref:Uncharacterized protein n=1 Tax=Dendrothele bispora (strain CBS 962.96) TaxID=1314807 RepID=A0A4S8KWQ0_DENBC|nr:hypothetical protein K435DRAFT_845115 [Dendrothele bispora CBS 962.96]